VAKVTNAFDTYTAKGNREDLSNIIYNISPVDTPILSSIGRRNISNVTFDWQTESLPSVDTANAYEEGFELSRTAATATVRVSNIAQISKRDATVTGSQQAANAAGKADEMARQMSISAKALKRDMESILSQNQAKVVGNASTARKTRALEHWLTTNVSRGATGAAAVSDTAVMTDGTQRAFTEALLKTVLQTAYTNGAEPSMIVVGPVNKVKLSDFTGRSQARQNVSATTIQQAVSVYASDFGDVKVVPSRFTRERTALLLDPEYAKVAFYRNFQQTEIAKIGDADTRMLTAEWGLEVSNEAAHAAIFDLTTS
jgi:hypothetical protein